MTAVEYARSSDGHVAYRVAGAPGKVDVVMVSGALFPFEMLAEDRTTSRFTSGLAALGRLVVFDKRGIGLSDPITDWTRKGLLKEWLPPLMTRETVLRGWIHAPQVPPGVQA